MFGIFFKVKEEGRSISSGNMKKIQDIHDSSADMGASCSTPVWGSVYESARIYEAALPYNTSHGSLHWTHMPNALKKHLGVKDTWEERGPHISSIFPEHVVYSHQGQDYKQKYSLKHGTAGSDPEITFHGDRKKVHTAYVDSADQASESMQVITDVPADWVEAKERFISKAERDKADSKDFAGKHKSFPILSADDVQAALDSIGRAGSDNHDAATLKKNILKIAKRKGFAVPGSDKESAQSVVTTLSGDEILMTEGVVMERMQESESALPNPIDVKLISAGWGSMGYYPAEVLKRDGPEVYGVGTHMFWNHATEAQEQDRPEGDLSDLAAVLTEAAQWKENGPKGPGLYAKAKVFSDYATQVAEKGPHIGVSINTYVKGKEGEVEGRRGRIVEKLIKTNLNSVDFVTRAGAGGAPIVHAQESDRAQLGKESEMTDAEIQALVTSNKNLEAQLAQLQESQNRVLAVATVGAVLKEAEIPFSLKVLERACYAPVMKEGKLDQEWIKGIVTDFSDGVEGGVQGMGHQRESSREVVTDKAADEKLKESFKILGVPEAGLSYATRGMERGK